MVTFEIDCRVPEHPRHTFTSWSGSSCHLIHYLFSHIHSTSPVKTSGECVSLEVNGEVFKWLQTVSELGKNGLELGECAWQLPERFVGFQSLLWHSDFFETKIVQGTL